MTPTNGTRKGQCNLQEAKLCGNRCHSMTKQVPSTLQSPEPLCYHTLRRNQETNSVAFTYASGPERFTKVSNNEI